MAKGGIIVGGAILLVIAVIGYVIPINDVTTEGLPITITIPNAVGICNSDMGQLSQVYNSEVAQSCSMYSLMIMGIYGSGILGIILITVGAVVSGKIGKDTSTVCKYCNFVGQTEAELLGHKAKNHLDKSPFKCEHCDFIGITEEILWNHYKDKHPDKKKW